MRKQTDEERAAVCQGAISAIAYLSVNPEVLNLIASPALQNTTAMFIAAKVLAQYEEDDDATTTAPGILKDIESYKEKVKFIHEVLQGKVVCLNH